MQESISSAANINAINDLSIVLCAEAGQGIQTIEFALAHIIKNAGYHLFATKEYMSRVRGGCNSTSIRISSNEISAFINRIDILIPLTTKAIPHLKSRISKDTLILTKQEGNEPSNYKIDNIDFAKIAQEAGNKLYESSVAIGFILGILKINQDAYKSFFADHFSEKGDEIIKGNIIAADNGYNLGVEAIASGKIKHNLTPPTNDTKNVLLNGAETIALGAIAGGCNFISSYPMSPSTAVLNQLAMRSKTFDIIVEQAEDEISAINMGLGAWYAGARAIATTSGGGFALMAESLSLAGITETPMVILLAQRPGPATGLPTRTEQGELNFALYAGHGEFPRILLAPGTLEQGFHLAQKAFTFADKFQVPVILLVDQYFIDSYYTIKPIDISTLTEIKYEIIETQTDYKRYQLTDNGISPRGIPNFGNGIVCVDSDEHTEEGYITEDFDLRGKMVEKRLKKLEAIAAEIIPPEFIGTDNCKTLIVCWGSNYNIVKEALKTLNRDDIGFLHFSQVYPLPQSVVKYFNKPEKMIKTIVIENNATAQFANLLKLQLGIKIDATILKYNGLPFAVEEIAAAISEKIK